jgi:hypothetical protein
LSEGKRFQYFTVMQVNLTPEREGQLAQIATQADPTAEQLMNEIVLRLLEGETQSRPAATELPVWHLGGVGALHPLRQCPLSQALSVRMFSSKPWTPTLRNMPRHASWWTRREAGPQLFM